MLWHSDAESDISPSSRFCHSPSGECGFVPGYLLGECSRNSDCKNTTVTVEPVQLPQMQEGQAFCAWWKSNLLALVSSQFKPSGHTV